jgi:type III pantothenate kinase
VRNADDEHGAPSTEYRAKWLPAFLPVSAQPTSGVLLLLDIGNTHTHAALAHGQRLSRAVNLPTAAWQRGEMLAALLRHLREETPDHVALCSVVPDATSQAARMAKRVWGIKPFQLTSETSCGVGIDYPTPDTIGPDRLANAIAARHRFGAPVVVVDFGTAVTFDVVNRSGDYVGGIIAPGLAAMTSYLHEKTALLPKIKIREVSAVVGKSTEQAMLIGAVHGYRGLIRELIQKLKSELKSRRLPVVATGGYAELMAKKLPEITAVDSLLTLKGLRRACELNPMCGIVPK